MNVDRHEVRQRRQPEFRVLNLVFIQPVTRRKMHVAENERTGRGRIAPAMNVLDDQS
jgi:hypothetical protein